MNTLPTTIVASVSDTFLDKAPRLFNASLGDIHNEVFQNARRAGASSVHLTIEPVDGDRRAVTIKDDGRGIADPSVLLRLADSGWSADIQTREDPAGMGLWSLAHAGTTIRSQGWRVTISPEAFQGKIPVPVETTDRIVGTEITFATDASEDALQHAVERAAHYYPVDVTFQGQPVKRVDFLADCAMVLEWNGIRIGIGPDRRRHHFSHEADLNFHGVTILAGLPRIAMGRRHCQALADIRNAPDLKLVLPARKEAVANEALAQLKLRAEKLIYEYIATLESHTLPYQLWCRARELGVTLPEAARLLRPWRPRTAEGERRAHVEKVAPGDDAIVLDSDDAAAEQTLERAIALSGNPLPLFEAKSAYEGYSWYDALRKARIKAIDMRFGDRTVHALRSGRAALRPLARERMGLDPYHERPDSAEVILALRKGRQRTNLRLPTDLVLTDSDWYCDPDEMAWNIVRRPQISVADCVDYLEAAYFQASDDAEAGSYDAQQTAFRDAAYTIVRHLLLTPKQATAGDIHTILGKVAWELRSLRFNEIRITPCRSKHGPVLVAKITHRKGSVTIIDRI